MKEHVEHSTQCVKRGRRWQGHGEELALVSLAIADRARTRSLTAEPAGSARTLGPPPESPLPEASTEESAECMDSAEDRG